MIDPAQITDQADQLIASYQELLNRSQHDDLSDLPTWETEELASRLYAAIERSVPPTSTYFKEAKSVSETQPIHLRNPILLGILRAIKSDVRAGWLWSVAEVLHADTFTDFLAQSTELLDKGYKDAAAVLAGAVLEVHLKLLCDKQGVTTHQPNGAPKKATVLNADLVKAGLYGKVQQKVIDAWQGIRNAAAHGEFDAYDDLAVRNLISGLLAFIAGNPA